MFHPDNAGPVPMYLFWQQNELVEFVGTFWNCTCVVPDRMYELTLYES